MQMAQDRGRHDPLAHLGGMTAERPLCLSIRPRLGVNVFTNTEEDRGAHATRVDL